MRHFKVKISKGKHSMQLTFSQGSAHKEDPTLADVLNCIGSDIAGYENTQGFEDWAGDYGYDIDSRKAEKTYKAIERQREAAVRVLGDEAVQELCWDTNEDGAE